VKSRVLRRVLIVVLGALVLCAVVSLRAVLSAHGELRRAEVALAHAELDRGIHHLRLAGRWDAPFNPYAASALAQLSSIAERAEGAGEAERALYAYRSLHAALAASHSPFRHPARVAAYREGLSLHRPHTGFVLLAFAGLIAWIFGFASLLLFGLDREGRVVRRIARPSFLFFAFGWVAFAVGLRLA
jgi:hypothetical protein